MKKIYKTNWLFYLKSAMMVGALLFAGTSMAQLSGTYTINSGATTSGTNYTDFADFASAINTNGVSGPVVVNVVSGSGPYFEHLELTAFSGSSATNTVTINGNGETLSHAGTSSRPQTVMFKGCDYVTIDDLDIVNTGSAYARNVQMRDLTQYCNVTNSTMSQPNMTSTSSRNCYVVLGNASNFSVFTYQNGPENCTISGCTMSSGTNRGPYWGVFSSGARGNSATKPNKIMNNEITDWYYYGVRLYYEDNGYVISGNNIHNSDQTRSGAKFGIYAYQYQSGGDLIIRDNYIHSLNNTASGSYNSKYGIYCYAYDNQGTGKWEIINNVIDLVSTYYGYGVYAYAYFGGSSFDIVNNTITFQKEGSQTNTGRLYGIFAGYMSGNIKNNIIYSDIENASQNIYGFYWYDYGSGYGPPVFTNNNINFDDVTGSGPVDYGFYQNTTYSSFAALSGATGTGWNNGKAAWADRANLDYSVVGFGLSNAGTPHTGVTTDITGAARDVSTPDVGAVEFVVDGEIVSVDMIASATECAPYSESVVVTVKNNGGAPMPQMPIKYSVNGGPEVQEMVAGPIAAGASVQHTFANPTMFNGSASHVVLVEVDGVDDNTSNNAGTYSFSTIASPTGGDLVMSSTFGGYYNNGSAGDPDVTVNTYESRYDITRPTAYSAAGPGTDYTYMLNATTSGGVVVGSAEGFEIVGEELIVDPATSLSDSTIWMEVTVNDLNTGCDTVFGRYMYVPHTPVASFDAMDICLGDVAQFTNTSTLEGNDYMLQEWDFDDPDPAVTDDNSDILDGFWSYTTYGTADVTLTVVNGVYPKFEYTATHTITVTPKPEVDFKVLNACEGSAIQFNNLTTLPVPGTLAYAWDFSDGNTSTATSPTHTYSTPGQRAVTLTATANGCDAILTKNAYQFEAPTANFTHVGACNQEDIQFTNTSSIPNGANMGYTWSFNSGAGVSTLENPVYNSPTFGTIPVSLTVVSEFGCTDVSTQNITLLESPVADFSWNNGGPACNLTPVSFTNTGTAPNGGANTSYAWSEDGTQFSTNANPTHPLPEIGLHAITLTAADLNGCSNTVTKDVETVLQATADFVAMNVCEGQEAVFTNTSTVAAGNLDYIWTFPSGETGTSTNHTGKEVWPVTGSTRVINVTLDAIVPGGCSDQITKAVTINAVPDASFTANVEGRFVYVSAAATSGVSIYQWNTDEGTPAGSETAATEAYEFTNIDEGMFDICLAVKNDNCWNDQCDPVSISLASIEDLTENNDMIKVYPNPTAGEFNLEVDNASENVVVLVSDILGNSIPLELTDNLNGNYVVNLSGIANGVYFVQVRNGDFYATQKITVSK